MMFRAARRILIDEKSFSTTATLSPGPNSRSGVVSELLKLFVPGIGEPIYMRVPYSREWSLSKTNGWQLAWSTDLAGFGSGPEIDPLRVL